MIKLIDDFNKKNYNRQREKKLNTARKYRMIIFFP